ncbi:MAG: hypothetical protein ABSH28_16095 [Acidobacteriota bacterium]
MTFFLIMEPRDLRIHKINEAFMYLFESQILASFELETQSISHQKDKLFGRDIDIKSNKTRGVNRDQVNTAQDKRMTITKEQEHLENVYNRYKEKAREKFERASELRIFQRPGYP